jgi:hypothetical protein
MLARAAEIGIRALVFTEHNLIWPEDEIEALQAAFPAVRLYRGIEVTSAKGDDYLVYGVTDHDLLASGMEDAEIISRAQRRGGAVVLAHPYRYGPDAPEVLDDHPVDGIEVLSSNIYNYAHLPAVALAHRLHIPATAASDGHHTSMLGLYAMDADALPADERELAEMVRAGEMRVCVDEARVAEENQALSAEIPEILQLMQRGLSDGEIRERLSIYVNLTVIQGLRSGKNVLRPTRAALPLPQVCARASA